MTTKDKIKTEIDKITNHRLDELLRLIKEFEDKSQMLHGGGFLAKLKNIKIKNQIL